MPQFFSAATLCVTQCLSLLCKSPNFKGSIWTSVIKESIWIVIDSHFHANNMILIGTWLVIYTVSLGSAVQCASSVLRWNYSAITHTELILAVIAQRKPHYPAIRTPKPNIQPFLPLVAHLKSNLKHHIGQSRLLKWKETKSLHKTWELIVFVYYRLWWKVCILFMQNDIAVKIGGCIIAIGVLWFILTWSFIFLLKTVMRRLQILGNQGLWFLAASGEKDTPSPLAL